MYDEVAGLTVRINADTSQFNAGIKEAAQLGVQFSRSISSAFEDVIFKGKDLGDVFRSLALDMSKMVFKSAFKPLEQAVGGAFTQLFSGFGGGGAPSLFAKGGVVAAPTAFSLGNGKSGIAGEAGPEAILPLIRGADGRLGVRQAGGGRNVTINFNVSSPDVDSFKRSETQINAMLNRAVARGERNL
ncbi:MAG: phage tail tape measure protein [bacterium]|nr:phage tail tape measure protein [bacterium]